MADTFLEGAARNRALGVYAGAAGSGGAIGLILGAVIVNYLSWRWVLFVNIPIGVVGVLLVLRFIENAREADVPPFDWRGFLLTGPDLIRDGQRPKGAGCSS